MAYKFSLNKAKKYVSLIKKGEAKNPFQTKDSVYSLKEFAKIKGEKNFRIVVDFMASDISKTKEKGLKFFKKEPLVFIEVLIMLVDHGDKANYTIIQQARGLKVKKVPVGKTQKYFQKLYGRQFYVN